MVVKLSRDERMELLKILPFHGEDKYRKLYDDFRLEIGFDEDEINEWDELKEKKFEVGKNLNGKILDAILEIDIRTDVQESLFKKFS